MKILWLGQAGLLLVSGQTKIMIDPYLTDSISKYNHEFARKLKVNKKLFKIKPSAIIITNTHSDHADAGTIEKLIKRLKKKSEVTILSCKNVFDELIEIPTICQANNIVLEEGSEWTIGNINICAVPAKTDDTSAIGIIITDNDDNKKYYITGDTLYNKHLFKYIPNDIYATFLPINGTYGSMNLADAKRFASNISSSYFVPYHFGLFDKIDASKFDLENAIIPKPYKIISFDSSDSVSLKKQLDSKFNEKKAKKTKAIAIEDDLATIEDDVVAISEECEAINTSLDDVEENEVITSDVQEAIKEASDEAIEESIDEADDNIAEAEAEADIETDVESTTEDIIDNADDIEDDIDEGDNIPFEAGNWEEYVSSSSNDNDDTDEGDDLDSIIEEDMAQEASINQVESDSDKIDAYIKEIEKFERGETTDFSTIG